MAACRAVICAALWPDPADPLCPQSFRDAAAEQLLVFARRVFPEKITARRSNCKRQPRPRAWPVGNRLSVPASCWTRPIPNTRMCCGLPSWTSSPTSPTGTTRRSSLSGDLPSAHPGSPRGPRRHPRHPAAGGRSVCRRRLDPVGGFAGWCRCRCLRSQPGGGAAQQGCVGVCPKYGKRLADEVRKWGQWVKERAEKELAEFYPKDPDGATPIAYLWARTVKCEGPGCGAEVPLMRSLWLSSRKNPRVLKIVADKTARTVDFQIIDAPSEKNAGEGTVARGSVTCPCCGFTTPVAAVRKQLQKRHGERPTLACSASLRHARRKRGDSIDCPTSGISRLPRRR